MIFNNGVSYDIPFLLPRTAVAAHKLGRQFVGFELDPDYYARGQKRLSQVMAQTSFFDVLSPIKL